MMTSSSEKVFDFLRWITQSDGGEEAVNEIVRSGGLSLLCENAERESVLIVVTEIVLQVLSAKSLKQHQLVSTVTKGVLDFLIPERFHLILPNRSPKRRSQTSHFIVAILLRVFTLINNLNPGKFSLVQPSHIKPLIALLTSLAQSSRRAPETDQSVCSLLSVFAILSRRGVMVQV